MWEPGKPSQNEDEYFARKDAEWLKERREALDVERAAKEAAEQRPKCPRCEQPLEERKFKNLRIDVCILGHGVWLDAGELEMILHLPRAEFLAVVGEVESASRSK